MAEVSKLAGRTRTGHRWWCSCVQCRPWNPTKLQRTIDRRQGRADIDDQLRY
jgi:hypothetical protein